MSLTVPNELNKADLSLNSSTSFTDVRLPHALTSSTQRLGIQIPPNLGISAFDLEQLEPLIVQLNQRGLKLIASNDCSQALVYLQEGQNLLEMVAGCGKSIDRQLILTILNNQAYAYYHKGKLDLSKRYVEAIIYNINSYLDHPLQASIGLQVQQLIQEEKSSEEITAFLKSKWSAVKTFINRTKELSKAQLQYAALLFQNYQNSASALMGLKSIKNMIEHFKLSKIYQKLIEKDHPCQGSNIIKSIIQMDPQLNILQYDFLEKKVKDRIEGVTEVGPLQLSEMMVNKLNSSRLSDFWTIRPQQYKGYDISNVPNQITIDCSLSNFLQKYLQIGVTYFLIGSSRMRELNQTQFLLGSSTQYQESRKLSIKQAELYYFKSLQLILEYLPLDAKLSTELITSFNSRFEQEMRIRVLEVPKMCSSRQSKSSISSKKKTESISSSLNEELETERQIDRLLPPVVDNCGLDLSSVDSVNLNPNASMLDILKQAEEASKSNEDEQLYFEFMPKKQEKSNPLFQATGDLKQLINSAKSQDKPKKQIKEISIEETLPTKHQQKSLKTVQTSRKRQSEIKSKSKKKTSVEKREGMRSLKKKGCPSPFETHYMSAYDLSIKEKRSKSKKKITEIKSERFFTDNINPESSKKCSKNPSKFVSMKKIKLNKVKSPDRNPHLSPERYPHLKNKGNTDKNQKCRSKSKSKPLSLKVNHLKSKSLAKGLQFKKSPQKTNNIYLQRKK